MVKGPMHRSWAVALVSVGVALGGCGGNAKLDPGGEGGSTGSGSATCQQLEQAYASVLEDARACDVAVDEPPMDEAQCTELVFSSLPCPCQEVFVNTLNGGEVNALDAIRAEYEERGCGTESCPTIACLPPTQGTCEGVGATGSCQSE